MSFYCSTIYFKTIFENIDMFLSTIYSSHQFSIFVGIVGLFYILLLIKIYFAFDIIINYIKKTNNRIDNYIISLIKKNDELSEINKNINKKIFEMTSKINFIENNINSLNKKNNKLLNKINNIDKDFV